MSFPAPLRTEWLRLKSHILDPATGRPTFPGVLEEARRLLERGETVGILYIDTGGGGRLEAQHGWQAYDLTLAAAAHALEQARTEGILAPDDIVAPLGPRSDKFVLIIAGPGGRPANAAQLETCAGALSEALRIAIAKAAAEPSGAALAVPLVGLALAHRDPMM